MSRSTAPRSGIPNNGTRAKSAAEHYLPLGQKIEGLIAMMLQAISGMPRAQKPIIGKQIECSMWDLLELVTRAGRRFHKSTTLQDAVIALDMLRAKVRVAHGSRLISGGAYQRVSFAMAEIGVDLGAWYKSEKSKAEAGKPKNVLGASEG
ncbi:MAG: four helix bundle protein [Aeromonas sp.]